MCVELAVWPGTGELPDTELVELAVSLASTELCSGAPNYDNGNSFIKKKIIILDQTFGPL